MRKAFTLVELAIVLVIIGLLVGGVLAGQELIKQAKYRKQISEWEDVKRAYNTYVLKYNAMPGDDNRAVSRLGAARNGNNDKAIGSLTTAFAYGIGIAPDASDYERCNFFQHLGLSELYPMLPGLVGSNCSVSLYPGSTVPSLMGSPSFFWWVTNESPNNTQPTGITPGEKTICTGTRYKTGATYGLYMAPNIENDGWPLTIEEAFYFDSKLDDGVPNRGRTVAMTNSLSSNITCSQRYNTITATTGCMNASNQYNLNHSSGAGSYQCALSIKMGF